MGTMDDVSLPLVVKLGVTATMLLFGQWMMYPSHVCKRCRVSTGMMGTLGIAMVIALVGYGLYSLVNRR
jgi:hypothetical protein